MKKISLIFFTAIGLFLSACGAQETPATENDTPAASETQKTAAASTGYTNLNVAEFNAKMQEAGVIILDVRTKEETAEGIIPGAMEINVKDQAGFKDALQDLEKDRTYLVYCRSGKRSSKACGIMAGLGFSSLYNLEGGYLEWSKSAENAGGGE
ncbi:MAG: rhodanese-like domain-containing protein [Saprospiraceae bacterium]|nr:rhodanese-like domain-containing protein [Saprospiraceae bacterium]